jgi:hypothetical protein
MVTLSTTSSDDLLEPSPGSHARHRRARGRGRGFSRLTHIVAVKAIEV